MGPRDTFWAQQLRHLVEIFFYFIGGLCEDQPARPEVAHAHSAMHSRAGRV